MTIRIAAYRASPSPLVQVFVDIEVDGWVRLNGLNYLRDGTLKSSQLTYYRDGKPSYLSAVVVIEEDLRELVAEEVLGAIHTYVAALPPEERSRPPRPPTVRLPGPPTVPVPEKSATNSKKALPPPGRLLAGVAKDGSQNRRRNAMTHNVNEKGQPAGAWAVAARNPAGEFGIAIGHDNVQVGFVPEARLTDFMNAGFKVDNDHDDLLKLVVDAAAGLEKFKSDFERAHPRSSRAKDN